MVLPELGSLHLTTQAIEDLGLKGHLALIPSWQMSPSWQVGLEQAPPDDPERQAIDGYKTNEVVYACIREIAATAAEVHLQVLSGNGQPTSPTHALQHLLDSPNPEHSAFELIEGLLTDLLISGNAFILKQRSTGSTNSNASHTHQPIEALWKLRPDRIRVVPGTRRLIDAYIHRVGDRETRFDPQDIIHFRLPDPTNDLWGLSPVQVVARQIDTDTEASKFVHAFFRNAAVPFGIIKLKRSLRGGETDRALTYRAGQQPAFRLEGLDLTWWLHQRIIVPPTGSSHDEQLDVPAETAIRHYLADHLIAPLDPTRAIALPADLEPAHDPPLGPHVTVRARYVNLARQLQRLAVQANLGLHAERLPDGTVRFGVSPQVDRTASSAQPISAQPVVFSPETGTTVNLGFVKNSIRSRNTIYVLGEGSAETRLLEVVKDDTDILQHETREMALDARDASTSAAATDAGQAELASQANDRVRLEVQPSPLSPVAYRTHWDLGDIVTVDLPDLGLQIDRPLESVQLSVDDQNPLRIICAFGAPAPDATDTLRRIDERTAPARFA